LSRAVRLVLVVLVVLVACNDGVVLTITSDRAAPRAIDAICLGVADAHGHQFGRAYPIDQLPQTLRVEPGNASSAWAWVRGDQGGTAVARSAGKLTFSSDVTLALDSCLAGAKGTPQMVGTPVGPPNAHLAASQGASGTLVVAVADGAAAIIDAEHGELIVRDAPAPPAGIVEQVLAADLDGDCDDDIIVITTGAPPALWRRDGNTFVDAGTLGSSPVAAVAAADVDHDGGIDLVTGSGSTLSLWINDRAGAFTRDTKALAGQGRVSSIRSIAMGDLDGDGNADIVVGQAGDPLVAWLGAVGGGFQPNDAVVPPIPLDVRQVQLIDADGDLDPDLAVAVNGAAGMRLYINREGRLEDQTFVRLPQPAPIASAIAIGGWDDACEPDFVLANPNGGASLHGTSVNGPMTMDAAMPAASDAILADIDDDGDLDALFATQDGVLWLARS